MPFGHLGDGNVHYNLLQPEGIAREAFIALKEEVQRQVFDLVAALGGTISAEHGIGRLKRAELATRKSAVELALMRQIKQALDPKGILNPGAIL
jgi:FAD/FMN-containing dehydrogenase